LKKRDILYVVDNWEIAKITTISSGSYRFGVYHRIKEAYSDHKEVGYMIANNKCSWCWQKAPDEIITLYKLLK